MNYSCYRITLDNYATSSQVVLNAKQGDTGRKIFISLTEGSLPYEIEDGCRAVFTADKPDETVIYNDCEIDGNVIIYTITKQTTAAVGFVACEIKLYDKDDVLLISPRFGLLVEESVFNDQDIAGSGHEFNAVADIIAYTTIKYLEEHPVATDGTLSITGMAADAKATGQAIQSATSVANQAINAANSASQSASSAYNEASAANTAASNAQAAADYAKKSANSAKSDASNALSVANSKTSKKNLTVRLSASGWKNNSQTVTANGVTSSNDVFVTAAPSSYAVYAECMVYCTSQGSNSLTFGCVSVPSTEVSVNVIIFD